MRRLLAIWIEISSRCNEVQFPEEPVEESKGVATLLSSGLSHVFIPEEGGDNGRLYKMVSSR